MIKKNIPFYLIILLAMIFNFGCIKKNKQEVSPSEEAKNPEAAYHLSAPLAKGSVSLEETLMARRTHRSFIDEPVTEENISQILWAAYGITQPLSGFPQARGGLRTAPSAGLLYPLEIYLVAGKVSGIDPGLYRYVAEGHCLVRIMDKDVRSKLARAALGQNMVKEAPACLVYTAVYDRTASTYGDRGRERYVCMELGHSAENVYLQVEALHLGTCAVGAFDDNEVKSVLQLPEEEVPLYIMPVGNYYRKAEF